MTKNKINKNESNSILCVNCGKTFGESGVHRGRVRNDGTVKRCKTCDWIHRHGGLPLVDGFEDCQIRVALEFILTEESLYLNDLADKLNMSIDSAIKLVNGLRLKGKRYMLRLTCAYCGRQFDEHVSVYLSNKYSYCSRECYWEHKRMIVERGEDSVLYNRIKTSCTNCGKEILITPSKYNDVNRFGDNHNFCCQKCYWEYRSKYYVGDKGSHSGYEISDENKEKMRAAFIEWTKSNDRFDSKIQLVVNDILDKNNIKYEREYRVKYYAIDNYLVDSGLMIEVMGDYWHASPLVYNDFSFTNKTQKKDVHIDKSKHTYIRNIYGKEILYLWEYDVNNNVDLCEALILEYINNDGRLDNYHSFNWNYNNGILSMNDDVITPYQDIKI